MLRPINSLDIPIINEWISIDPDHSAKGMTADFFRQPDTVVFAIDDEDGPIMYFRLDPINADVVQLHTQFNERARARTAIALVRNFPEVRDRIRQSGAKYMVFDSMSPSLVRFCKRRFGFAFIPDANQYYLDIQGK